MTEGERAAHDMPDMTLGAVLRRLAVGAAIVAGITAAGLGIYRNQRDRAGMPVAVAPRPRETPAPTVEGVITRYEKQVQKAPDDADGWRNLGWSYFQRGQFDQAADALRHATELDPTDARTFSFLGEALLQAEMPKARMPHEARAAFDAALKLDPKDARARYYRAVGWDLSGQHHRAIHAWFALLRETPPDAPYAGDIRAVIRTVGARHHIKVEKRLAEVQFTPPGLSKPSTTPPAHAGKATLPGPAGDRMRAVEGVPRPVRSGAAQAD
jgi:cytochrome c-type biogenesis protein CcmH